MTDKKKVPLVIYENGNRYVVGEAYVSVDDEGRLFQVEATINPSINPQAAHHAQSMLNVYTGPVSLSVGSHSAFGEVGVGWTPELGVKFSSMWRKANPTLGINPSEEIPKKENPDV
jgi:hypothetical protein